MRVSFYASPKVDISQLVIDQLKKKNDTGEDDTAGAAEE